MRTRLVACRSGDEFMRGRVGFLLSLGTVMVGTPALAQLTPSSQPDIWQYGTQPLPGLSSVRQTPNVQPSAPAQPVNNQNVTDHVAVVVSAAAGHAARRRHILFRHHRRRLLRRQHIRDPRQPPCRLGLLRAARSAMGQARPELHLCHRRLGRGPRLREILVRRSDQRRRRRELHGHARQQHAGRRRRALHS